MNKLGKRIFLLLFTILLINFSNHSFAMNDSNLDFEVCDESKVITNKKEIDDILTKDKSIQVPEGYKVEKIIIENKFIEDINYDLDNIEGHFNKDISKKPLFFSGYQIKNVRKDNYQIIFPDSPLRVSRYEGPASAKMSISDSVSNSFSSYTGVSLELLESKVGFSASTSRTITDVHSVEVPKNKILEIKAYVLYDQWRLDVYKWNKFIGVEFAHKPVGISFKTIFYSK